eukprot:ANDGO_05395.mRNA.1 hypothetical protein
MGKHASGSPLKSSPIRIPHPPDSARNSTDVHHKRRQEYHEFVAQAVPAASPGAVIDDKSHYPLFHQDSSSFLTMDDSLRRPRSTERRRSRGLQGAERPLPSNSSRTSDCFPVDLLELVRQKKEKKWRRRRRTLLDNPLEQVHADGSSGSLSVRAKEQLASMNHEDHISEMKIMEIGRKRRSLSNPAGFDAARTVTFAKNGESLEDRFAGTKMSGDPLSGIANGSSRSRIPLMDARTARQEIDPLDDASTPLYSSFSKDEVFHPAKVPLLRARSISKLKRKDSDGTMSDATSSDVEVSPRTPLQPSSSSSSLEKFPAYVLRRMQSNGGLRSRSFSLESARSPLRSSGSFGSQPMDVLERTRQQHLESAGIVMEPAAGSPNCNESPRRNSISSLLLPRRDSASSLPQSPQSVPAANGHPITVPPLSLRHVAASADSRSEVDFSDSVSNYAGSSASPHVPRMVSVRDSRDIQKQLLPILKDVKVSTPRSHSHDSISKLANGIRVSGFFDHPHP